MIRIEVVSSNIDERSGNKNGKDWLIREQGAWAFVLDAEGNPSKYPVACSIMLEKGDMPYQPGFYTVDPRSIYVGDFRRLEIGRLRLIPETPMGRKAA
jgi:hypothetical protein